MDQLEFYRGPNLVASVKSSMVPPINSLISIRQKTYRVIQITYAMDNADGPQLRSMRANIDITPVE